MKYCPYIVSVQTVRSKVTVVTYNAHINKSCTGNIQAQKRKRPRKFRFDALLPVFIYLFELRIVTQ